MDLLDLEHGLKCVASGGNLLNCQEICGLSAGLTLLRSQEECADISFWGKVFGEKDYYVAYCLRTPEFEFPPKHFYYAGDGFEFRRLECLTGDMADRVTALGIEKAFTGNPEELLEKPTGEEEPPPAEEDGAEVEVAGPPKLTELHRLAQVVQEIDFDTAAVPKGAYALSEAHVVSPSGDFRGLGLSEAASLAQYVHFRPPAGISCLRALARSDSQFHAGFLDPLEADLPKGCWAIRQDASASLVTLRSLSWPGYIAFHVPETRKFGGAYFGHAQRCRELPFLV